MGEKAEADASQDVSGRFPLEMVEIGKRFFGMPAVGLRDGP